MMSDPARYGTFRPNESVNMVNDAESTLHPASVSTDAFGRLAARASRIGSSRPNVPPSVVISPDTAPTTSVKEAFAAVEKSIDELQNNWNDVKSKDIASLNEDLRKANLSAIDPNAPVEPAAQASAEDEP